MGGFVVTKIHPKLLLFLRCCPSLDLNHFKCLPHSGGLLDQNYDNILYFDLIERKIKEIMRRKSLEKR